MVGGFQRITVMQSKSAKMPSAGTPVTRALNIAMPGPSVFSVLRMAEMKIATHINAQASGIAVRATHAVRSTRSRVEAMP